MTALGLPADLDDIGEAITDKIREGYDIPAFVFSYLEALKTADRRRRRRPRYQPKSRLEAARLLGRLMGHIEGVMEDYFTDTYELTAREARPVHILAGARIADAIANMAQTLGGLSDGAWRIRLEYQRLDPAPGADESEER